MYKLGSAMTFAILLCRIQAIHKPRDLGFVDTFKSFKSTDWHVAEYDFTHPHFATDWRKSQVLFGARGEKLQTSVQLTLQPGKSGKRFLGGSIRRLIKTKHGTYSAWLKAAKGEGVVTGFFTYHRAFLWHAA